MVGHWLNSFFVFMPISSHLDRASLVNKGFIIWDKTPKHDLCTCGTKRVSPGDNHSARHIIK